MPKTDNFTRKFVLGFAVGALGYQIWKNTDFRGTISALCELLASDPEISPDLARDAFTTTEVAPAVPTQGHTHPDAAALRTSATNFARQMAAYTGVELFVVGMSKSDQRKGLRGSRQWYWAKDTNAENRSDNPGSDDIEYICDVDYYMDMPDFLAKRAKPTILYTVVPEAAASSGEDNTSLCFTEDGALSTIVTGAGGYEHHIWDYAADSLIVRDTTWGITTKLITYAVERKQVGRNRQLVLLTPIRVFGGVSAWIASWLLAGRCLERFDPIEVSSDGQSFVRFTVHSPVGTVVTTGKPNVYLCATVPSSVDSAIAGVARLGSTKLMLPTTASWLGKDDRGQAVMLTEYHRSCIPKKMPTVYPVALGVRAYQYEPRTYDQEAKPKLEAFMSPIVHGAFAPVPNVAGERRCVKGRIEDLRKEEPKPHSFRDQCIEEFATQIIEGMVLEPVCYEVVEAKQTSPAQKLSLLKATLMGPLKKLILKCFLKSESYQDVKDPRNISTYNDGDKLEMATFALALSAHCKRLPWYGPGMTPDQIANRVVEICAKSNFVNVSDLHRMDGTITRVLRMVDRVTIMKAFPSHRASLNELLKTNVDNRGYLPHGTTFDQGPSHGSGCSATSLFQTLRAAFTAYLAFRNALSPKGSRYCPYEAFDAIGIHLGDDGLDGDLPVANHMWAASKVGLVLEASVVHRGDRGVNFLARYYSPEVWTGCPDSMCDIKRQLSKFHTTVRLPHGVTPEQKLVEKCMSYLATDSNTPVMGEFCKKVLVLSDYRPKTLLGVGSWWSKFENSVQYPNSNAGNWMDSELSHSFPEFDRSVFDTWMASAGSIEEALKAPLCAEPKPATPAPVDVVVDGDVLPARLQAVAEEETKREEGREIVAVVSPPPSESSSNSWTEVRRTRRPKGAKHQKPAPVKGTMDKSTDAKRKTREKYVAKRKESANSDKKTN